MYHVCCVVLPIPYFPNRISEIRLYLCEESSNNSIGRVKKNKMKMILAAEQLDKEWVDLIFAARDIGISIEEIRVFLENCSSKPLSMKD